MVAGVDTLGALVDVGAGDAIALIPDGAIAKICARRIRACRQGMTIRSSKGTFIDIHAVLAIALETGFTRAYK